MSVRTELPVFVLSVNLLIIDINNEEHWPKDQALLDDLVYKVVYDETFSNTWKSRSTMSNDLLHHKLRRHCCKSIGAFVMEAML